MKPFYRLTDSDLRSWMANFVTQCNYLGGSLGLNASDLAAIQAAADDFGAQLEALEVARTLAKSTTIDKDVQRDSTETTVRKYANRFRANPNVTDSMLVALGLPDRNTASTVPLYVPTSLEAVSAATGRNVLKWKRAGNKPGATFVVEVRFGNGDWVLAGATPSAIFESEGNPVGTPTFYRVYAQRDGRRSDYSEVVALYAQSVTLAA